jgi:hypothetical protein
MYHAYYSKFSLYIFLSDESYIYMLIYAYYIYACLDLNSLFEFQIFLVSNSLTELVIPFFFRVMDV